jgi:Flp pilus assembly pilin Flp
MNTMTHRLRGLVHEDDGAAASEYAVLLAILIVSITAAVSLFNIGDAYRAVTAKVQQCVNGSC